MFRTTTFYLGEDKFSIGNPFPVSYVYYCLICFFFLLISIIALPFSFKDGSLAYSILFLADFSFYPHLLNNEAVVWSNLCKVSKTVWVKLVQQGEKCSLNVLSISATVVLPNWK